MSELGEFAIGFVGGSVWTIVVTGFLYWWLKETEGGQSDE